MQLTRKKEIFMYMNINSFKDNKRDREQIVIQKEDKRRITEIKHMRQISSEKNNLDKKTKSFLTI